MNRQTYVVKSYIDTDKTLNRIYYNVVGNAGDIIIWMADNGIVYSKIFGVECHDIGDQDYFCGSVKTNDVAEILAFDIKLYGEWNIYGSYVGVELQISKIGVNIFEGVYFKYPADEEAKLESFFSEFEKSFCTEDIKVVNEKS